MNLRVQECINAGWPVLYKTKTTCPNRLKFYISIHDAKLQYEIEKQLFSCNTRAPMYKGFLLWYKTECKILEKSLTIFNLYINLKMCY